jgi:GntR family transcriptional regulator, trigonelline degradation regulator
MSVAEGENALRVQRPLKTLRELALAKMRESILTFHFEPGVRLVERDLCAQLGVSRTVVREVLRHLESEGLVTILPNRGPIVAETSPEEALQIYEIRSALEGLAARACAERGDGEIAAALQRTLETIRAAYAAKDLAGVLAATTEFYRLLFQGADKDVAWGIVSALTLRINRLRSMTIKSAGRDVSGPDEMQTIVDAVRRRDGDAAAEAAQRHVERASLIARRILDAQRRD